MQPPPAPAKSSVSCSRILLSPGSGSFIVIKILPSITANLGVTGFQPVFWGDCLPRTAKHALLSLY